MDALHIEYLRALDIPVWVSRDTEPEPATVPMQDTRLLRLGPGNSAVLCVCHAADETASVLAADISRALGEAPVWAFPDEGPGTMEIEQAVDEHLNAFVLVFGEALAGEVLGAEPGSRIQSARVLVAPSLQELETSPASRKALWQLVVSAGLVKSV